ncbi:hypothetical protein BKP35_16220 [Anaerobacillus arseniciselenatis]|uniref:Swt1-like HEPN domain-containing protein n=1 Tax=Anaerobacillus arseniciselenatis TaxID=85682 RepID=A0A1S2LA87_9BACI|nr:hypothetical protein [Anaerobacillus arseniciselenatis]OIJ09402.1 hypothetical protein BKP35_16220 [Anaerobacillus arseniciselenatis]
MNEKELEYMKSAYGMLYEIEVKLDRMIVANLTKKYGYTWLLQRYETKTALHTRISYFVRYPNTLPHFTEDQIKLLYKLPNIRNKIAHAVLIDESEYKQIEKCYRLVKRQPIRKRERKSLIS